MKRQHPEVSQQELCRSLGVSRQAHHKQGRRLERVVRDNEAIVQLVKGVREEQPKLGGRKLHYLLAAQLEGSCEIMGRDRFFHLLRQEYLLVRPRRRSTRTTMSRHGMPVYPDLVKGLPITAPGYG